VHGKQKQAGRNNAPTRRRENLKMPIVSKKNTDCAKIKLNKYNNAQLSTIKLIQSTQSIQIEKNMKYK